LLGKYQLVETVAAGGMGAIWRAHNQLLDSEVAIKVLFHVPTDVAAGEGLQRALSEARLAAQLHHPALCTALDVSTSEHGDPFIVYELLHGDGLDAVLATEGPLSATNAVRLLLPILDGLGLVHNKGIVHRDVKPANIFLARDESGNIQPKLLDFGIAKKHDETENITFTNLVSGTPPYMSPEQICGGSDLDLRSDLWSISVTLYELVSDRMPFEADSHNGTMLAVIYQPHAPLTELPVEDCDLVAIINRGLSKDRNDRYQSTLHLAKDLSRFLLSRGVEEDACGHSLRARLSSPAMNLTGSELALLRGHSTHHETAAKSPSLLPMVKQWRLPIRRRHLLALGFTALLGLLAWASGGRQVKAGDLPSSKAITSSPRPPIRIIAELVPPEARVDDNPHSGASKKEASPRGQVAGPVFPRHAPAKVLPSQRTQAAASPKPTPAPRTNALGYDFGL
jgi:serine/threonine-protein kinase